MSFNHNKFMAIVNSCCEAENSSTVTTNKPIKYLTIIPPIGLSNTTTTQTITSKLFGQNTINAGDYYTIKLTGNFNCAPNTSILIKLTLNTDNIISFLDVYSPPSSSTPWEIVIDVVFSSLNFVYSACKFMYGDNTQTGSGFKLRNGSASYDSTIDNNMVLAWKFTSLNAVNYCDAYIGSIIKL